ncbi:MULTISPECIES: hypothetical protein [Vibrio]|uniref:Outer membrane protein beta-barrel domain-containing protein n=1 Tax=Vibrio halioticoli NBRC 102217 TaxID=1219072 RepID=V5FFL4_9VIBR|nr:MULTISPECIES: hypothetical protein [Vibrio]MPW35942.1 hypothetical protein [Vibrio sp. B1Z05]GAD90538.1 hypothetical protein VHA01S_047_00070 [Vibrio halioticoli NBRC 102217]
MNKYVRIVSFAVCSVVSTSSIANESDDWQFSLAPLFVWGSNLNGNAEAGSGSLPLDLDFKNDLLSNLDAVFTFHFEAQKKDLILFAEYQNMTLTPSSTTPFGGTVDVTFKNQMGELGVGYVVGKMDNTNFEVLAGVRRLEQDISMNITGAPLPFPTSLSTGDTWYDGFVGGRVKTQFADKWQFVFRGDVGGGGSDFIWNTSAIVDYRFMDWGSAFFGYRAMGYDFDNGKDDSNKYAIDVVMQGPLAGLNIHW